MRTVLYILAFILLVVLGLFLRELTYRPRQLKETLREWKEKLAKRKK